MSHSIFLCRNYYESTGIGILGGVIAIYHWLGLFSKRHTGECFFFFFFFFFFSYFPQKIDMTLYTNCLCMKCKILNYGKNKKIFQFVVCWHITKTRLFKYIENFTTKEGKFSDKKLWYFSYFCSKHRLWYSLEPPRQGGSNEHPQSMFLSRNKKNKVYPCKPQFYYIKVVLKGVKII